MKKLFRHLFILLTVLVTAAGCEPTIKYWGNWCVDGLVSKVVFNGSTMYASGEFSHVFAVTGNGAALNNTTGLIAGLKKVPVINDTVYAAEPDGKGGWYIGGDFTMINDTPRNRIARINKNGTLHPWNPGADDTVRTIVKSGATLYVGGEFTTIASTARDNLASFTAASGELTGWDPSIGGAADTVYVVRVANGFVFVGGNFTSVGPATPSTRIGICSFNASTGALTSWDPGQISAISAMMVNGTTVYVGGIITNIGGQVRQNIAALDADPESANYGDATSWYPAGGANNAVLDLVYSDTNHVFAAGLFTTIGGQLRNGLVKMSKWDGTVDVSWDPAPDTAVVTSIERSAIASDFTLYVAGGFTNIFGEDRNCLAAVEISGSGSARDWDPSPDNAAQCLALSGNEIYVGGNFDYMNIRERTRVAAFNTSTGLLTDFSCTPNNPVLSMATTGDTLYLGGSFTTVNGTAQPRVAALDADTGVIRLDWNPVVDGTYVTKNAMTINRGVLYIGGDFTTVDGQGRNYIAAIDTDTGELDPAWSDPGLTGGVQAITVSGGMLYLGGYFTGPGSCDHIGKYNTKGWSEVWYTTADNAVYSIIADGKTLYTGGLFTGLGHFTDVKARSYVGSTTLNPQAATSWDPGADSRVNDLTVDTNAVFMGGNFTHAGGGGTGVAARNYLAKIMKSDGSADLIFDPSPDGEVLDLASAGDYLVVGGVMTSIAGYGFVGLAVIDKDTGRAINE